MSRMRERARDNFPTVLLTLLSMLQAIALETLWGQVRDFDHLYHLSLEAVLGWWLVMLSLAAIILVWVYTAHLAMRFRFEPREFDAILPFFIGIAEFFMIEVARPDSLPQWLIAIAAVFAATQYIMRSMMRRARKDPDNQEFFDIVLPETPRETLVRAMRSVVLVLVGIWGLMWPFNLATSVVLLAAVSALNIFQFYAIGRFWRVAMNAGQKP